MPPTETTEEIQQLEVRNLSLLAQNDELKRGLKDSEDHASTLQNQVQLLGKHQSQTTHALASLASTLQTLVAVCRNDSTPTY